MLIGNTPVSCNDPNRNGLKVVGDVESPDLPKETWDASMTIPLHIISSTLTYPAIIVCFNPNGLVQSTENFYGSLA